MEMKTIAKGRRKAALFEEVLTHLTTLALAAIIAGKP
jgi:hypothetical protein